MPDQPEEKGLAVPWSPDEYGRFPSKPVEDGYAAEAVGDHERDIYASRRSSRPAYTRPDPPCPECGRPQFETVGSGTDHPLTIETHADNRMGHAYGGTIRIVNAQPGHDKVTFPVMRQNQVKRMADDELVSPQGTLWRLQKAITDVKFDLLKKCIAAGEHMVSDIDCEIVISVSCKSLTDKAGAITKVKDHVTAVKLLLPNGEFNMGRH